LEKTCQVEDRELAPLPPSPMPSRIFLVSERRVEFHFLFLFFTSVVIN
jgi:hypothetical protein